MIFFVAYVLLLLVTYDSANICEFATPTKYIGYFYAQTGSVDITPYNFVNGSESEVCRKKCLLENLCYAVSFNGKDRCALYNTSNIIFHTGDPQAFYLWKRCQWDESSQPPDGRCNGLFVRYRDRVTTTIYNYIVLKVLKPTKVSNCLDECLAHPICEAANYNNFTKTCSLHQLWPHIYINETAQLHSDVYKWTCIPHFVDKLTLYKTPSQPNILKCTGYWDIVSRNFTLPNINSPGVYFHTLSYNTCLAECMMHSSCRMALFNVSVSLCVLPFTESSDRYEYLWTLTYIQFIWVCVKNDSGSIQMNDKERYYEKMGLTCVRLVDTNTVYIAEDNCGKLPTANKFESCKSLKNMNNWTVTDLCLVNQSFWKFPSSSHTLIINEDKIPNVTRIFSGLTSFWTAYADNRTYESVSFLECRRYNGAKGSKATNESAVISRSKWYAFTSQGELPTFYMKPKNIVITASQKPFYGCRTSDACSSLLRNLQLVYFNGASATDKFSDIPYNFMIDESGTIYETRGWTNQCAAVNPFNKNSLCFAFIGRFQDTEPTLEFLNGVKGLIELAVDKGYVDSNYTLYIHQDVTKVEIYRNLAIVIKMWNRYRGYQPKVCSNITRRTFTTNVLLICFILVVFSLTYRFFHSRKHCKKCNFLHKLRFQLIYPKEDTRISLDLGEITAYHGNTVNCIVKERPLPFFQNGVTIEFISLLKPWFLNKFIKSSCSCHVESHLGNYLLHLRGFQRHIRIYEAYSLNYKESTDDNLHIVVCCSTPLSYHLVDRLSSTEDCVCQYFSINFMTFSHLSFETVS